MAGSLKRGPAMPWLTKQLDEAIQQPNERRWQMVQSAQASVASHQLSDGVRRLGEAITATIAEFA